MDWDEAPPAPYPSGLEIITVNQRGQLASLTHTLSEFGVDLIRVEARPSSDRKVIFRVEFLVHTLEELDQIVESIEPLQGIISVVRFREEG